VTSETGECLAFHNVSSRFWTSGGPGNQGVHKLSTFSAKGASDTNNESKQIMVNKSVE